MTCIVGLVDEDKVYIGGDSAGVAGYNITVRKDKKVFKNGSFIMGFTSSFRMGDLLHWSFEPPEHPSKMSVDKFMRTVFIDAVRACLKEGGYSVIENNNERAGCFIVGYRGKLFSIYSDFQVGESVVLYDSVGCGSLYALGSLYSTKGNPKKRILIALKAAEEFSSGVVSPFQVLSMSRE